jgi:hypothetical protein
MPRRATSLTLVYVAYARPLTREERAGRAKGIGGGPAMAAGTMWRPSCAIYGYRRLLILVLQRISSRETQGWVLISPPFYSFGERWKDRLGAPLSTNKTAHDLLSLPNRKASWSI